MTIFKTENTIIPFTIFSVLFLLSFFPLVQISSLYLNGGLLYGISITFGTKVQSITDINIILSIGSLIALSVSKRTFTKILFNILSAFFLQSFVMFHFEHETISELYFINFILLAIITCLPICILGLIKENTNNKTIS